MKTKMSNFNKKNILFIFIKQIHTTYVIIFILKIRLKTDALLFFDL